MSRVRSRPKLASEGKTQGMALLALLVMGGLAIAGPSGILAWSENQRLLELRKEQAVQLEADKDQLRNRVDLLNPGNVDPDLAGQLLRDRLNVAHPDEMVILLD